VLVAAVFAPIGGFRAVSKSMEKLAQSRGVAIETGKTVTHIGTNGVHIFNNRHGIKGAASFVPADLVIVNADLPYASRSLVETSTNAKAIDPEEPRFDWDDSFVFSSGVVAFHWAIDKELKDLNTHNVFLAASEGKTQAEESDIAPTVEPFNFYVHRATATDPSAAPQDHDSIMVLVPCPALQREPEYACLPRDDAILLYQAQFDAVYISHLRKAVLKRFMAIESLADLELHILNEVVDTPATFADQYHVGAGTPFALSHGFAQLSVARPGPKFGLCKSHNVLYCGASSRPGNGVPLVLTGSKLVAQKSMAILKEMTDSDKWSL
jgi:phytoene desaturase (3,4-didehydrolycopene-forming)